MQKDNIKNAKNYYGLSNRLQEGLKYLENTDFSRIENGRYEILGSDVYAIVQEYQSKLEKDAKFEAHKKYIDIQYVVKGEELIGVSGVSNFEYETEFNTEKDIVFLQPKEKIKYDYIKLNSGEFAILYPSDAHKPSVAADNPRYVKKVVVKVLV